MSENMSLLVSLIERNRVVEFTGSSVSELVNSVNEAFTDLIPKSAQPVLQVRDESWGGMFIDVQSLEMVKDRSILRILLEKRESGVSIVCQIL